MNNFYLFFNIFTLVNLSVLFIILFFRKNNSVTNRLLALIIINPGLNCINNIFIQTGLIFKVPFVLFFCYGTAQLYAPLVFAYVILMMGRKFKLFSILNIITICVILLDIYFSIEYCFMTQSEKFQYINCLTSVENFPIQMNIINGLFVVVMLAYFVVAFINIIKHYKVVKDFHSDIDKTKVKYIKHFVLLLTILNILLTITYIAFATPSVEYFYIPLILNIVYIYIVYYAFKHSAILTKPEFCNLVDNNASLERYKELQEPLCREIKEIKQAKKEGKTKYSLTDIEIEENYKKILTYFTEEKPYLDPSLNLTKLANSLDACSHNISLTINTRFNMIFFDLVNSYRINEAKKKLTEIDKNNLTIEAIGFDSGFNTKSSFYRAFKKHTGITPSEYILSRKKIN